MSESTEHLLHLLNVAIDNLDKVIADESRRQETGLHYHLNRAEYSTCSKVGCAGLDPLYASVTLLQQREIGLLQKYNLVYFPTLNLDTEGSVSAE